MKDSVTLHLSDVQYQFLVEAFNYGIIAKKYLDNLEDEGLTGLEMEEIIDLQNELFRHHEKFNLDGIELDEEQSIHKLDPMCEMSLKADALISTFDAIERG